MLRTLVQRQARSVAALKPSASVPVRFFSDEAEDKDPKAIQALVDQKVLKANQTVTPWHARDELGRHLKVPPVENPEEVAAIKFEPEVTKQRKAKIYKPVKQAMSSGVHKYKNWELNFESQEKWINPLMGWTSGGDPLANHKLKFETKEQAVRFAEKQGWSFEVHEPVARRNFRGTKAYSHNFLPVSVENNMKRNGVNAMHHFHNQNEHQSTWQKTLKYHGDGDCIQHGGDVEY